LTAFVFARNAARHYFGPPHGLARTAPPDKSVGAVVGGCHHRID
jgi:hypothetical protein